MRKSGFPTSISIVRRRVLAAGAMAVLCALGLAGHASQALAAQAASEKIKVVATFSILADMAREVGGGHVDVAAIVGPNSDAHAFEPTPADVRELAQARVLVLNGLDFEGWLPRLLASSGFKGLQVLASDGVHVRRLDADNVAGEANADDHDHDHAGEHGHGEAHDHGGHHHEHAAGDVDPHAWQDLTNGAIYARNIAEGLAAADPRNAYYYRQRAEMYIQKMGKLDAEIKSSLKDIPPQRRVVITSHDAFGYFSDAYGIRFISVAGFSSAAEPSAADVARIIDRCRREHVAAIFIENMANTKVVQQIARETGVPTGGTLYSDALAPPGEPASTYLGMFSWNAGRLIRVLKPAP